MSANKFPRRWEVRHPLRTARQMAARNREQGQTPRRAQDMRPTLRKTRS